MNKKDENYLPLRQPRRDFLKKSLAIMAGVGMAPYAWSQAEVSKPNIVFIIVDDMGWADVGCYGQDAYPTPNIDRMAEEGIRFTQAYAGCTVCAPARSTLMTGQHMGHTPVRGNTGGIPLPEESVTVAEVLKQAGYTCGGFGKWGLGDLDTEGVPEKQGFDEFFGYYHQIHAHYFYPEYLIDTGKKVPLEGNENFYEHHNESGPMPKESQGKERQFSHDLIFDRMKQFIRENKDKPFFCYAPWTPPHARYELPREDPAWQAVKDKPWPMNAKIHAAFNMIADRHVGETLDLLKELEIEDNTIVFFCSDNGASNRFEGSLDSSGPLTGNKRSMHEGGIRVPLIARWPGKIKAGQVSDLLTYFPDFLPTAAQLAGVEGRMPEEIDGVSIVPTLMGKEQEQEKHSHMYWEWPKYNWGKKEYTGRMQALRHQDWKLLRHDNEQPWQLYDLSKDLAEEHNLAEQHPDVVKELDAWVKANRTDPVPQIEPEKPEGKRYR